MKAIILAAGMGTRLGEYTKELPKCMLSFLGKPLIEHQVAALRAAGIKDIAIVRGYEPDKINITGVKYAFNPEFATTNMVATLMCAEDLWKDSPDGVLICYADLVYEPRLISQVLAGDAELNVVADLDWQEYWKARLDDWESDVESLEFDPKTNRITDLGETGCSLDKAIARYVGLLYFKPKAASTLRTAFHELQEKLWNIQPDQKWRRSRSFKKGYMTCMVKEMIDRGIDTKIIPTKRGWLEFDTVSDYERCTQWAKEGSLKRFINT